MHRTLMAAILCTTVVLPASAGAISGGKVIAVNDAGNSIAYRWKNRNLIFKTNDKTVIKVNKNTGRLSDIRAGKLAQIQFIRQGTERIALIIGIGF
jgi:hypothetical protein